jgi:hypothetical protein
MILLQSSDELPIYVVQLRRFNKQTGVERLIDRNVRVTNNVANRVKQIANPLVKTGVDDRVRKHLVLAAVSQYRCVLELLHGGPCPEASQRWIGDESLM